MLSGSEELRFLPPGLRTGLWVELRRALRSGAVAATFVKDVPASFCYVMAEMEGPGDISIDTLLKVQEPGLRRVVWLT